MKKLICLLALISIGKLEAQAPPYPLIPTITAGATQPLKCNNGDLSFQVFTYTWYTCGPNNTWSILNQQSIGAVVSVTGTSPIVVTGPTANPVVTCPTCNTGGTAFSNLTSGTNNTAAMVVDTGGSFAVPTQTTGDTSTLAASDQFVANAIATVNAAVAVEAATTTVLPFSPTYNNGTAGVGATLTAGSNGVLTIDTYSPALNEPVLVKNQASALQNGIYTLTTVGTVSVPYVLTRRSDYNAVANINYTGTIPVICQNGTSPCTDGSTNGGTGWNLVTQITAVGTSSITYSQAYPSSTPSPSGNVRKGQGNLGNGDFILGAGGNSIVDAGFSQVPNAKIANPSTTVAGQTCTLGSSCAITILCQPGLGDGLNAISAGTYLQNTCFNTFGATYTITGIRCYTDNAGSSTLNVTNGAGTALLTGAITCGSTIPGVAGTQSGTTTIANSDGMKFTFVADGTSKQTTWAITLTR